MSTNTLITYLGGSGGDFVARCCNGSGLLFKGQYTIEPTATIKTYENDYKDNIISTTDLISKIDNLEGPYVTTHLYKIIAELNYPVISLIIDNPKIQEKMILRQMQLQNLVLKQSGENSIFSIIKNYCLREEYTKAATLFFESSRKRWIASMQYRINNPLPGSQVVNISDIFDSSKFINIINQLPITSENHAEVSRNHEIWLDRQPDFNKNTTIDSISKKLAGMDFSSDNTYIKFNT